MKNIYYCCIVAFICCFPNLSKAQNTIFYESDYKPLVIWVYPAEMQKEVNQNISKLEDYKKQKYRFFLLSDSLNSKASITKKINDLLNTASNIDIQRVYYLEWGHKSQSQYFVNENKDILADFHYYTIKESNLDFNLDNVLKQFDKHYLWHITLSQIEEKSLITNPQIRKFSYGISFGQTSQNTFKEDSAYLPASIGKLGLTIGYRINPRLYLLGRGQFSFKIPDQSGLQSTLFSQINISAGGKQTVAIDMKMHIFVQGSLQANYFLTSSQKLRPFIGGGLTFLSFKSAKAHQEIEIDLSSMTNGGGIPSGLGNSTDVDLPFFAGKTLTPFLTLGFSYKLFKNVSILGSADYDYKDKKSLDNGGIVNLNHNLSFNIGLQFEFQKKQKKYFQYLR